jgi:hypothetical protein
LTGRLAARCCMPAPSPLALFLEPLERLSLPYCVTGSVAASVYGEPRLTADIDIVLLLGVRDIAALRTEFPDAEYYVPPDETLRLELARDTRGMFNLIHHASQFKADIYLAARDPLHAWALKHRRRISLEEGGAWIAPPEYVILRKLEYLREGAQDKHVRDIRFILAASDIDRALVDAEVMRLGLSEQWLLCQPDR